MIKYVGPGSIALTTWLGEPLSEHIPGHVWMETKWTGFGAKLRWLFNRHLETDPRQSFAMKLGVTQGPRRINVFIALLDEGGEVLHRWDTHARSEPKLEIEAQFHQGEAW